MQLRKRPVRVGASPPRRYWSAEEHARFLEAIVLYGTRDAKRIAEHVGNKTATQVRTHGQKYWLRLASRPDLGSALEIVEQYFPT